MGACAAVRLPEGARLSVRHPVDVRGVGRGLDEAEALCDHLDLVHIRVPDQLRSVLDVKVWKPAGSKQETERQH